MRFYRNCQTLLLGFQVDNISTIDRRPSSLWSLRHAYGIFVFGASALLLECMAGPFIEVFHFWKLTAS